MIWVKLIIAVTLSQSHAARVLKPNELTVTKEDGGLEKSIQPLWQCNEKQEYLRGLQDGRIQFAREMQEKITWEEFWEDDDYPDSEMYLNAFEDDCNEIYYDDGIYMGLKDC